eukprot:720231_1
MFEYWYIAIISLACIIIGTYYLFFKKNQQPTLPIPVKEIDLFSKDENAIKQFRSDFRNLGFAVLEMDESFWECAREYRTLSSNWLYNNSIQHKLKYESVAKDELFAELGRKPNIGYILTEYKKEYLKYKNTSNEDTFPSKQIYNSFKKLFSKWNNAAMTCMDTILSEPIKKNPNKKQNYVEEKDEKNDDEIYANGMEPLTSKIDRDNIRKFGAIHSSLSLIHYFSRRCAKEDEEKLATRDEKLTNRTVEVPLDVHVDTGVITMVSCSDVCGLEMLDRKTNKYFKPEEIFDPNKHVFCHAGRKMELFSWKNAIKPTWHAVRIPLSTNRLCLLYFMEIQKDH